VRLKLASCAVVFSFGFLASCAVDSRYYDVACKCEATTGLDGADAQTVGYVAKPAPDQEAIDPARRLATSTDLRTRAPQLLARPDGPDLKELPLQAMRVSTVLLPTRARTLVDLTYENPFGHQLEGTLLVQLPEGASPCYLGMFQGTPDPRIDPLHLLPPPLEDHGLLLDQNKSLVFSHWRGDNGVVEWGTLRPARVVSQEQGKVAYERTTRRRVDPALMEWSTGNTFRTRVFPITANGKKRILFAYDQAPRDLGEKTAVVLPVPEKLPRAFQLEVAASDTFGGATLLQGANETPLARKGGFFTGAWRGDALAATSFVLEASQAPEVRAAFGSGKDVVGALVHVRVAPRVEKRDDVPTGAAVFLLDTSLSQRAKLGASCGQLLRAILERDATIDRFQVLTFDVAARPLFAGWRPNTADARTETLAEVEKLWLEGATNLDAALGAAEKALGDDHATCFLLSDAQATWGLEDARELERAHPRSFSERWIGYQIGEQAVNRGFLDRLTRRGGRVVNVLGGQDLERAALAHRSNGQPLRGVRVEGVEPRDLVVAGSPSVLYPGETVEVAFRAPNDDPTKATLVLETDREVRYSLAGACPNDVLAPRAWAELAANALLELGDKDADRVALALSQRFALANRVASFLMLETDWDYQAQQIETAELAPGAIAAAAAQRIAARPVGAPATDGLDERARAFLAKISQLEGTPWPLHPRPVNQNRFERPRWPAVLDVTAVHRDAERRFEAGRTEEALRVLSSIVEEAPRDAAALRLAGFTLMGWERYGDALALFARIRLVRPFEPQAYLAEALALEALGRPQAAAVRYELVLAGRFDPRYENYAKEAGRRLYGRLLARMGETERARELGLGDGYPAHEVHLLWNLDDTDVDLHVVEPDGTKVDYTHRTSEHGMLLWDNTAGLGPEIYINSEVAPAKVAVHYYGTRSVAGTAPAATLLVRFDGKDVHCRATVLPGQNEYFTLFDARSP
jgi:tetratricopeptide (TPR) repeat protein